jgi:DNA polymerase-3 subunit delta
VYELSNALAEKDLGKALLILQGLLESGLFPLQILSAMVNQIRKLILVKDLSDTIFQARPMGAMEYRTFQQKVLPKIQKVEGNPIAGQLHPYVLYMNLGYVRNYSMAQLVEALKTCLWADVQLKSSGHQSRMVLEKAVMDICRA